MESDKVSSAPQKKFSEEDLLAAKASVEAGLVLQDERGFQESGMDVANRLLNSSVVPGQRLSMNIPDVTSLYDMNVEEEDTNEDQDLYDKDETEGSLNNAGKKQKWWNSDASVQASVRATKVKIFSTKDMLQKRYAELEEQIAMAKSTDGDASQVEIRIAQKLLEGVGLVLGSDPAALATYIEKFAKSHEATSVVSGHVGKAGKRGLNDIGNAPPCALYKNLSILSTVEEKACEAVLASEDAEGLKLAKKEVAEMLEPCKSLAAAARSAVTELKRSVKLAETGKLSANPKKKAV